MTKMATKEVTIKELAAAFERKYVNISSTDHYGISIEIHKGTIEYENDIVPELWLVSRDNDNNVTGSVCISEDTIESIEESNGIYTVNFNYNMTSVDVSQYKTLEELQKSTDEKEK